MPIGINSPARNLFLLGSSGAQVVTNFFKQIDQASSGDYFHTPSEIRYTESDEKFILAGEADKTSPTSEKYGWIEKRQEDGTQDWETQVSSTTGDNTSLQALELDGSNLVAVGKTGGVPWIAKYTDGGVVTWQSTTNSADVEYTGVAVDSNSNYYACGSTPVSGEAQAFVEKFDSSGNPGWGKSAFMIGRDVVLNKVSANSRGEVVAVGYLEDDSADKGYIIKIDTNTGDVLWDRTLELNIPAANIELTGVDVDNNDEIYVCGNIKYDVVGQTIPPVDGFIAKYTAEGNLLWQSQSDYASGTSSAVYYEDITIDNTTKKPTTFGYVRYAVGDSGTLISRYDPDGSLSWRREIDEGNSFDPRHTSVDGDQSFIYLLFADTADSETYVYGKVSATGNGLGDFEYDDGTGAPLLNYITSSGPNGSDIGEKIGRLSDGSVRNDTSDLMTYPFTANKLLFDDLATQVTNKKRQMDDADSFEYSGSPAVRVADFTEVDLGDESFDVNVDAGQQLYEEANTYTFTVPTGITEVSAVVVGGGGGSASCPGLSASSGGGGGGGGLAYGTFTVTPGEDLTVVVGAGGVGGASGTTAGTDGGSTTISRGATVLLEGGGGAGGLANATGSSNSAGSTALGGGSSGTERDGGGSGGNGGAPRVNNGGGGGGGAGGYTGNGGRAGSGNSEVGNSGSGGGGGGGGGQLAGGTQNNGGGGVGLFGGPINGPGGVNGSPGGGGSNGQVGQSGGKGGKFGGGGGGAEDDTNTSGADGGTGGARIIWGAGRSYPDNAAQDFSSVETRVRDKSGKGNNGVVNGATLNAAGYWEFDGVDDNILIDKVLINSTEEHTFEAWFNTNSNTTTQYIVDQSPLAPNSGGFLRVLYNGNSYLQFLMYHGGGFQLNVQVLNAITLNQWHHVVGTVKASTNETKLYLDGVEIGSANTAFTTLEIPPAGTKFAIGSDFQSSGNYFNGEIAEVRVYPRALTAAQVFQNYNATKSKYINEAPDTAPKIGPGIVYDSNLLLNYDFGNRATYDRAENLLAYSEDFTLNNVSTGWRTDAPQYSRATLIANTGIDSPVGTNNASRWQSGNNNNQELIYHLVPTALTVGKTYTASCWIRRVESFGPVRFYIGDNAAQDVTTQLDAVPFGTWVRCSATYTVTGANGTPIRNYISVFPNGNVDGGDKTTIDIWGMNVNEGSTPGRYVKTYGSAITAPTTVKNLSSSSYPSTISGAEFNSDGYFVFDNANNDEIISSQTTVADTGMPGMTLEIWANLSNSTVFGTGGNAWLFGEEGRYRLIYTGTQINWVCSTVNNGWYTTGTAITADSLSILDSWHHIVGVYDGTNIRLDLDGTTIVTSTSAISGNVSSSGDPLMSLMGTDAANVGWGTGSIGQVRIYNRGLTATEVSQNFNATRAKYGV